MLQCKVISLYFAVKSLKTATSDAVSSDVAVFKHGCCLKAEGQNVNFSNLFELNFLCALAL